MSKKKRKKRRKPTAETGCIFYQLKMTENFRNFTKEAADYREMAYSSFCRNAILAAAEKELNT